MNDILSYLGEFNIVSVFVRIVLAMFTGAAIGIGREKTGRPAGFRTHILVSLGACMTAMIGEYVYSVMGLKADPLRVAAQVISGIGFLGVGTILVKSHDNIIGLTTAAGLWATAATGIAAGYGFFEGTIICTFAILLTTVILSQVEKGKKERHKIARVYLEIENVEEVNAITDALKTKLLAKCISVTSPRSKKTGYIGIEVKILQTGENDCTSYLEKIRAIEGVKFAVRDDSEIII